MTIVFFCNDTATTEIYTYLHTLSLHDALPIFRLPEEHRRRDWTGWRRTGAADREPGGRFARTTRGGRREGSTGRSRRNAPEPESTMRAGDRKSTRLNSSH